MASYTSSARRALFACNGPMSCQRAPGTSAAFAAPSWTRFSPRIVSPAATASRSRAASTVLETATRLTSVGARPARSHAAAMRASTRARAAPKAATPGFDWVTSALKNAGRCRRGSLAAQEARDLEVVRVVGRLATHRRNLTDRPLDARRRHDRRRLVLVLRRGERAAAVGDFLALALELLEEIALVR